MAPPRRRAGGAALAAAALAAAARAAEAEGWVGLGNTGEVHIEDGVDKSPIRVSGGSGKGLGDDDSFKLPGYADSLHADPACFEADPEWAEYRLALQMEYQDPEMDEDMKALTAWQFFMDSGFKQFKVLDKKANSCFLGICATLYHVARHRMMVEGMYNSAVALAKSLDRFVASIHPSKFDDANKVDAGGSWWPVSDRMVGRLMRDIARESRGRMLDTNCGSERGCVNGTKPLHGNAFHAMANDTLPVRGLGPDEEVPTMASAFKVYVYDVDDYEELGVLASGLAFCKDNQWGFEVLLHLYFLACDCRTDDPTEADFFFVPQYTACHLNLKTFSEEESNALFESLIPKLKHFKRSDGRDHVFVWGAGFAVDGPFQNWRSYIQRSIFLMTETEFWNPYKWQIRSNYNAAKDIVLPGRLSIREIKQHHENAVPMGMRAYVGDFVGWNRPLHHSQGTAESPRQRLLKWAARFPDMHIRQDVPYAEALEGSVNSRFCFVPRGKSAWSSRMFRVLFGGCVPVLLNDDYELPFQALLGSAEEWLIRWPMREVTDELADTLRRLDTKTLEQMVRHAREPRCWYVWPPPTVDASHWELEDGDLDAICPEWRTKNAFVATMALLASKRRTTKASFKTFYAPRGPGEGRHFVDAQRNPV